MRAMVSPANEGNPYLAGPCAPVTAETEGRPLGVTGKIPKDLAGSFVRNGSNPRFDPKGRYHWFDGDGMLHAVRFEDGEAFYRNRWVRTPAFLREEQEGGPLWSGIMESTANNPTPFKDTSNTDVMVFGDKLLTSWWLCGTPYEVDPRTLATLGPAPFAAKPRFAMSAHGKADPRTGELFFFSYGMRPPFMQYGVVSPQGELVHHTPIELAGARLPHDMAITERHAVLMDLPMIFEPEALKQGRWVTTFRKDMPARFGVIPRRGAGTEVRWFEGSPCYIYHVVNSWEEGDTIVMVACKVDDPIPGVDPRDGRWGRMMANLRVTAHLARWRFDLRTGKTTEEKMDGRNAEFPRGNDGWTGYRSRHGYCVSIAPERSLAFDGLYKYDLETGACLEHRFGPGRWGSEPAFAPRVGATGEDDGYVLSFVHDDSKGRSELLVLDARDFSGEPVARIDLPTRVPLGFHGCWAPARGA